MASAMLTPGKLPGNEFAFKNALFVNPTDYQKFSKSSRRCFVTATKGPRTLHFELMQSPEIPEGQFGASTLQKDMLRISKIDDSPVQITKATSMVENPISQVEFQLELIKADPSVLTGTIVEV